MRYELKLTELAKVVKDYGKVEILEHVKGIYKSRCSEDIGLCSSLYFVLSFLPAIREHAEYHELTFVDEYGVSIPHWVAYQSIFPQWTRLVAWKLVYRPETIKDENDNMASWWLGGYWWPCEDHVARFEFLDKLIDYYKRNPLG